MRGARQKRTTRARTLRQQDNDAEAVLWRELRDRWLNGFKFVRQLPIGPYFADLACREARLVVEVDGSQHADRAADRARDRFMVENGWSVLRFWNLDVLKDREALAETIVAVLEGRLTEMVVSSDLKFIPARRGKA